MHIFHTITCAIVPTEHICIETERERERERERDGRAESAQQEKQQLSSLPSLFFSVLLIKPLNPFN